MFEIQRLFPLLKFCTCLNLWLNLSLTWFFFPLWFFRKPWGSVVNPTVTPGIYVSGILPTLLWKTAPEPKAERAKQLWVLYLLYQSSICYLHDDLRSRQGSQMEKPSLTHIISTGQKALAELYTGKCSILLPLSSCHDLSSVPLDSPVKYHPTSSASLYTVKYIIPPQVQHTNAAGGTREQIVAPTWWRLRRTWQFCCMKAAITHRPTVYHFWWETNQNKCGGTFSRREESALCL